METKVFDDDNCLILLDPATLPPENREAYETLRQAYLLNAGANEKLADLVAGLPADEAALSDLSAYVVQNFRPPSFMDEWAANKRH